MNVMRMPIAVLILTLATAAAVHAGDWPWFRGPARDGHSTDTGLLKSWPEGGPEKLWTQTGLGGGYSQAVVADGRIYVTGADGAKGYLTALDLDGKRLWRKSFGPVYTGRRGRFGGARSTPTVHRGRVFVAGSGGRLVAFDAKSGKKAWEIDFFAKYGVPQLKWGFSESVLVDGDKVILTPGGSALMVAYDHRDGSVLWTTPGFGEPAAYCSPMLIERGKTRLIVTITDGHVVGVEAATGKLLWKHVFVGGRRRNNATTPIYANGRIFCSAGYGKGSEILELAKDGRSVKLVWSHKKPDNHHGNLVLADGHVYGTGQNNGGQWVCVELATGTIKWETKGVGKGSVSFADGMLYCYGERGRVALVRPSDRGFMEAGTFTVTEGTGEHWAHPTIAGGRLYIRRGDALMAYDVREKPDSGR